MAVSPEHQRKGLGRVVLKALVDRIVEKAPSDGTPYITLLADPPGRRLYSSFGFVPTAYGEKLEGSLGMMYVPESVSEAQGET